MSPAHWVPCNETTRVPRRHVYLDCEAYQNDDGRQTLRCAVIGFDRWDRRTKRYVPRAFVTVRTTRDVWREVDECTAIGRTVLVAHNLAYDLRIADALAELPRLGWTLERFNFDDGAWCTWTKGDKAHRRKLIMCDTYAWTPKPLAELGNRLGIAKPPLPAWADSDEVWEARCRADVEILAALWRTLLAWIEDKDLGMWKATGAAQSWAAWRHRFMPVRVLVHDDPDARVAERAAAWTGRCEAWRHGVLPGGPWTEWDLECAYAHIGASCDVPVSPMGSSCAPELGPAQHYRARLCEVTVTTPVPVLPTHDAEGFIVWPVGTFATRVWEHELALLPDCASYRLHRTWHYRSAPALGPFCDWILDELATTKDPVAQVVLKHWSRAFVGRFGVRWSRWEDWGTVPGEDAIMLMRSLEGTELGKVMQLGERRLRAGEPLDGPDAVPSVMSWVMAEARVRLWKVMCAAGLDHVAYVDTDSVIVDPAGDERLRAARVPYLRPKGSWSQLEVLGPRQLILGGKLRAAGVPRRAVKVADRTWEAEVWSTLRADLSQGITNSVRVRKRRIRLAGTDRRRVHIEDGRTEAITL